MTTAGKGRWRLRRGRDCSGHGGSRASSELPRVVWAAAGTRGGKKGTPPANPRSRCPLSALASSEAPRVSGGVTKAPEGKKGVLPLQTQVSGVGSQHWKLLESGSAGVAGILWPAAGTGSGGGQNSIAVLSTAQKAHGEAAGGTSDSSRFQSGREPPRQSC